MLFARNSSRTIAAVCLVVLAIVQVPALATDIFHLEGGGEVQGIWLNRDLTTDKDYLIETPLGGILRLSKSDVQSVRGLRTVEVEYERRAPLQGNSLQQQWSLAEWCRANRLVDQCEAHLRRMLELDPDCVEARRALGYYQFQGRWVVSGEIQKEQGREYYEGRWRLPQEIVLLEERAKSRQAARDWSIQLKNRRRSLDRTGQLAQFRNDVSAIRDRHAIRPLLELLRVEPYQGLRLLYVQVIAEIDHASAAEALINISLDSVDAELVRRTVSKLVDRKDAGIVDAYLLVLRDPRNDRVNRAAYALGQLEDRRAIAPLIEALVTRHRIVLSDESSPEVQTATFSRNLQSSGPGHDNAAFSVGRGPRAVVIAAQNEEVLTALQAISGIVGYGYEQKSWQIWFAAQQRVPSPAPSRRN